jgi:fructose-1,6-bisphosphatase/inositol monophosphatase family enzyme
MTGHAIDKSELIQDMLDAVEAASIQTRRVIRETGVEISTKPNEALAGRKDYLTSEDKNNQRLIFEKLKAKYPDTHRFGEEDGLDTAKQNPEEGDTQWVLDPIDSTRNFVAGTADYSISLGCQEFRHGQWVTIADVVAMPKQHKTVWAEKGKGAFEQVLDGEFPNFARVEHPVKVIKHHRTGDAAFEGRAVEVLLVKEGEQLGSVYIYFNQSSVAA